MRHYERAELRNLNDGERYRDGESDLGDSARERLSKRDGGHETIPFGPHDEGSGLLAGESLCNPSPNRNFIAMISL